MTGHVAGCAVDGQAFGGVHWGAISAYWSLLLLGVIRLNGGIRFEKSVVGRMLTLQRTKR
jgi:hypothetical protein